MPYSNAGWSGAGFNTPLGGIAPTDSPIHHQKLTHRDQEKNL
jgi:hypothetical protein